MGNFKEDIALCEAIILDVDGVLTDGGIIPTVDGDFIRKYNAKDGYALAYAIKEGYNICIISGGRGQTLMNRLTMLGIKHIYIDCMDKIAAINDFCAKTGVNPAHALYMGDDIPDLDCMNFVGIPVAPADAAMEAIDAARYVSEYKGGCGCVRDVIEQVLRAKGDWAKHTGGVTGGHTASR
ncbi:MAG: HAD hydrolase family protein [Rikenellaceae bacterium]